MALSIILLQGSISALTNFARVTGYTEAIFAGFSADESVASAILNPRQYSLHALFAVVQSFVWSLAPLRVSAGGPDAAKTP